MGGPFPSMHHPPLSANCYFAFHARFARARHPPAAENHFYALVDSTDDEDELERLERDAFPWVESEVSSSQFALPVGGEPVVATFQSVGCVLLLTLPAPNQDAIPDFKRMFSGILGAMEKELDRHARASADESRGLRAPSRASASPFSACPTLAYFFFCSNQ